jgi:hypothetical protein
MTQAQGQAPAQAQEQVHAIHQETATLEALTKIVSETEDNDPHAGTDLEVRKEPVEGEPAQEQEVPAETEAQETVEFDEETPIFDVELKTENGKEAKKLSLKEMRDGYLRMQDYHRNIQKVKAQEAEYAQKVQQAEVQAAQQYAERIAMHQQAVQKLAGVKSMPEIEALSREDPAAAQQEFLRLLSVNQTMQGLENEKQAAIAKHQQAMREASLQAKLKSREILEADIKGWNADLYTKVLTGVAKDYGFRNEEVEPVVDARLIKVFHDAFQYRQLQQAKPGIEKKVALVPKVVRPGSGDKPNASSEVQELEARLKKSGKGDDFVALYLAKQKQQKRK